MKLVCETINLPTDEQNKELENPEYLINYLRNHLKMETLMVLKKL